MSQSQNQNLNTYQEHFYNTSNRPYPESSNPRKPHSQSSSSYFNPSAPGQGQSAAGHRNNHSIAKQNKENQGDKERQRQRDLSREGEGEELEFDGEGEEEEAEGEGEGEESFSDQEDLEDQEEPESSEASDSDRPSLKKSKSSKSSKVDHHHSGSATATEDPDPDNEENENFSKLKKNNRHSSGMGRKKIKIEKISAPKNRQVTFNKRKVGLMKKAMELSILCECDIMLLIFANDQLYQYSSEDVPSLIKKWHRFDGQVETLSNKDLNSLKPGRSSSRGNGIKRKRPLPIPDYLNTESASHTRSSNQNSTQSSTGTGSGARGPKNSNGNTSGPPSPVDDSSSYNQSSGTYNNSSSHHSSLPHLHHGNPNSSHYSSHSNSSPYIQGPGAGPVSGPHYSSHPHPSMHSMNPHASAPPPPSHSLYEDSYPARTPFSPTHNYSKTIPGDPAMYHGYRGPAPLPSPPHALQSPHGLSQQLSPRYMMANSMYSESPNYQMNNNHMDRISYYSPPVNIVRSMPDGSAMDSESGKPSDKDVNSNTSGSIAVGPVNANLSSNGSDKEKDIDQKDKEKNREVEKERESKFPRLSVNPSAASNNSLTTPSSNGSSMLSPDQRTPGGTLLSKRPQFKAPSSLKVESAPPESGADSAPAASEQENSISIIPDDKSQNVNKSEEGANQKVDDPESARISAPLSSTIQGLADLASSLPNPTTSPNPLASPLPSNVNPRSLPTPQSSLQGQGPLPSPSSYLSMPNDVAPNHLHSSYPPPDHSQMAYQSHYSSNPYHNASSHNPHHHNPVVPHSMMQGYPPYNNHPHGPSSHYSQHPPPPPSGPYRMEYGGHHMSGPVPSHHSHLHYTPPQSPSVPYVYDSYPQSGYAAMTSPSGTLQSPNNPNVLNYSTFFGPTPSSGSGPGPGPGPAGSSSVSVNSSHLVGVGMVGAGGHPKMSKNFVNPNKFHPNQIPQVSVHSHSVNGPPGPGGPGGPSGPLSSAPS